MLTYEQCYEMFLGMDEKTLSSAEEAQKLFMDKEDSLFDKIKLQKFISSSVELKPAPDIASTALCMMIYAFYQKGVAEHYKNLLEEVCKEQNKKEVV